MADAKFYYDELRFDVRDPDALHVYVFIRGEGDCPFMVHGWHHKAFPASVTTFDVLTAFTDGSESPISWEREAPRPVETPVLFNPWDRLPVPVEQLQQWRKYFEACNATYPAELAEQISAHLAAVPEWDKACPHCRAHDMMLQVQMAPPQ